MPTKPRKRLRCDSLEKTLSDQVAAGYASASTACQLDSDCTTGGDVGCYYTCGGEPALSVAGLEAAQQSLLESTTPVCAELIRRCGPRGAIRCPADVSILGCNNGTCQTLSCDDLQSRMSQRLREIPPPCDQITEPHAACVSGKCDIAYTPLQ